jgi:hypothetical protein
MTRTYLPIIDLTDILYQTEKIRAIYFFFGLPNYLSSDHDPLYRFHQWEANLRILEVLEIKTAPYVPVPHPFIERLIGTLRREYLDRMIFWTAADLETKLIDSQHYYNGRRTHAGLQERRPEPNGSEAPWSLIPIVGRSIAEALCQAQMAA